MERAHQRGVRVRVLLDHLGSRKYPGFNKMRKWFTQVGIEYHLSLPLHFFGSRYTRFDLRNHRKIVVIDGQVGFIGSQNIIKRNYFRKDSISYDELVAKVTGPVVAQLDAAFRTDWYPETSVLLNNETAPETALVPVAAGDILCQVLPSGSGFENENNLKLFTSLIHAAQKTVVICNPYFVPDDSLMTAITSAVQRGVDIKLVNSQVSDQFLVSHAERSYYEDLLTAGVKVYQYNAPILLHSKTMSIDDDIAKKRRRFEDGGFMKAIFVCFRVHRGFKPGPSWRETTPLREEDKKHWKETQVFATPGARHRLCSR